MSLLKDYFEETESRSIIERDYGFVTYVIKDKECYVEDVFIKKDSRGKGLSKDLEKLVVEQAIKHNCEVITGSVIPSYSTSTESMKMMLAMGYKIFKSENNFIGLYKEL